METLKRHLFLALIIFNLFILSEKTYASDTLSIKDVIVLNQKEFNQNYSNDFNTETTELSKKIVSDLSITQYMSIAVIDFSNLNGGTSEFSKFLCEELTSKLFQTKEFNIIERSQIDKIAKEQKLQLTGPIDRESMSRLGKLIGANAILTGTITDMQSFVRINARLISVSTGSILSANSVNIIKDDNIEKMLNTTIGDKSRVEKPKDSPIVHNYSNRSPKTKSSFYKTTGISFKLNSMKVDGDDVFCELLATSQTDEEVYIYHTGGEGTRVYTRSGHTYLPSVIYTDDRPHDRSCFSTRFIGGVPQIVNFIFKGAAKDIDSLYLITITYLEGSKLSVKKVPLQ